MIKHIHLPQLLDLLATGNWYTKNEIVLKLQSSPRSVNRYLKILRDAGLYVGYKKGKFALTTIELNAAQIKKLLNISEAEAERIYNKISRR